MTTTGTHFRRLVLSFFLVLAAIHVAAAISPVSPPPADANVTAHRELELNGFPQGLLPGNVISHTISDDGHFEVQLSGPCYCWYSDLAYFGSTIRGRINFGRIASLSGIQVRKFFIWFDVHDVVASKDGGSLMFTAGFFSERHPASEFHNIRTCEKKAQMSYTGAPVFRPTGGQPDVASS